MRDIAGKNREHADALRKSGIEVVELDVTNPGSVERAAFRWNSIDRGVLFRGIEIPNHFAIFSGERPNMTVDRT